MTIAICTPFRDHRVNPLFMRSVLAADLPKGTMTLDNVGYGVVDARNVLTAEGLKDPSVTHFMWIDDDAVFPADAVKRLFDHHLPIVGGLCFARRDPYAPILLHEDPARGYLYQYEYPEGLIEVDATGAHFLLVAREVFEAIIKKFPKDGPWSQLGYGEDVSMCRRARECGFRIMVDTTVKIGHIGEVIVDAAFAKKNRTIEVNAWPTRRCI